MGGIAADRNRAFLFSVIQSHRCLYFAMKLDELKLNFLQKKKRILSAHLDNRVVSGSFYGSGLLSSQNNPKKIPLQLEKPQLLLW